MAPFSYYWFISFIYLVIKNTTHPAFFKKPVNPFEGNNGNNEHDTGFFGYRVPLSFCNAFWEGGKKTTAVGDSLGSAAAGLVENFDALIVDIGDAIDSFERSVIDGTAGY